MPSANYLLKGNKQYVYNCEISQWSCLCEIFQNVVFLITGLNKKLHPERRLSLSVYQLVSKFSCDDSIDKCMIRKCKVCSSTSRIVKTVTSNPLQITMQRYLGVYGSNESNDDGDKDLISYYKWARSDESRLKKMLVKKSVNECITLFNTAMTTNIKYMFSAFHFLLQWRKKNPAKNDFLIHLDNSKSYENKQQHQTQIAYFGHTTFTIYFLFYFLDADNRVRSKLKAITSELPDHSRATAISCALKVIEPLRERHQHFPLKINTIILTAIRLTRIWSVLLRFTIFSFL